MSRGRARSLAAPLAPATWPWPGRGRGAISQPMSNPFPVLLIVALLAVVGVLFLGLFSMARGGEFNRKHGNRLMRWRVVMQGAALVLLALAMLTS